MRARFGDLATPVTSLPYDPLTTTNRMFISALPILSAVILCLSLLSPETGAARVSDLDSIRTVITAPHHQAGHDRMTWAQFSSTVLMQPQDCSATTASPSPHRELLDQVLAGAPSHFDWRDRGVISPVKNQVGRAHFRHISHGRHGLTEAGAGAIARFPILGAMHMAAHAGSLRLLLDLLHHRRHRVTPCNQIWDLAHTDPVGAAGRFHTQQKHRHYDDELFAYW